MSSISLLVLYISAFFFMCRSTHCSGRHRTFGRQLVMCIYGRNSRTRGNMGCPLSPSSSDFSVGQFLGYHGPWLMVLLIHAGCRRTMIYDLSRCIVLPAGPVRAQRSSHMFIGDQGHVDIACSSHLKIHYTKQIYQERCCLRCRGLLRIDRNGLQQSLAISI